MTDKLIITGNNSKLKENNRVNINGENGANSLNVINNNAKYYTDKAQKYANQAEQSAINSANSAEQARASVDSILLNEDFIAVNNNLETINTIANSIENVDFVGENIEQINQLVDDLEALDDTTNINIVVTNITGVNTTATNINNVNKVANSISNVDNIANNLTEVLNAKTYANNAKSSATSAQTYANNSLTYSNNASNSANNAKTSETNAKNSQELAKKWAVSDGIVENGLRSAKYYAQHAQGLSDVTYEHLRASRAYEDKGAVLSDEEGFATVQKYNHSTFDLSKFTVVGSPTITEDGVASGFVQGSSYITASLNITTTKMIIRNKFNYKVNTASNSILYWFNVITLRQYIVNNGDLRIDGTASPANLYINVPASNFKEGDVVETELIIDTSVKLNIKVNGVSIKQYTSDRIPTLSNITQVGIGSSYYQGNNPYQGSIDLKHFSITVDGKEVFNGNKTGLDVIKPDDYTVVGSPTISTDGVANGFSTSNYITKTIPISAGSHIEIISKIDEIIGSTGNRVLYSLVSGSTTLFELRFTATGLSFIVIGADTATTRTIFATEIFTKKYIKTDYYNGTLNIYTGDTLGNLTAISQNPITGIYDLAIDKINIGVSYANSLPFTDGSIDLNAFKIYVDGDLVYQPCLKIPYTESKTGSKVVDAVYRDRVIDLYEQEGHAGYYTIDEEKKNFTLPMGEIYGTVEKAKEYAKNAGFPSGKYVDLTLGESGAEYVAPANGWFWASGMVTGSGNSLTLMSSLGITSRGTCVTTSGNTLFVYLPVSKGQKVTLEYPNISKGVIKFIYAEGEV